MGQELGRLNAQQKPYIWYSRLLMLFWNGDSNIYRLEMTTCLGIFPNEVDYIHDWKWHSMTLSDHSQNEILMYRPWNLAMPLYDTLVGTPKMTSKLYMTLCVTFVGVAPKGNYYIQVGNDTVCHAMTLSGFLPKRKFLHTCCNWHPMTPPGRIHARNLTLYMTLFDTQIAL